MFRILTNVVSSSRFPSDYPLHRPVSFRRVIQPFCFFLLLYFC